MSVKPVILRARVKQTASLIFLHGLGDTGHGWARILNNIRTDSLKVICPTAPVIPVSLNLGLRMPAWFDIESLDNLEQESDIEGLKASAKMVHKHIEGEVKSGIPSNRIIIGGFSQGAVIALYSAMHCKNPLAGCIALSTFFPDTLLPDYSRVQNKEIPYFQAHGDSDHILPLQVGVSTSQRLKQFLPNHEFKTYSCKHECSDRELRDVKLFIEKLVAKSSPTTYTRDDQNSLRGRTFC